MPVFWQTQLTRRKAMRFLAAGSGLPLFAGSASGHATQSKDPRRLTPKPPLGWNSYDCYLADVDERALLANLEVFAQRLKPVGYEYFVIDCRWFAPAKDGTLARLDAYGRPLPSETKFPRGFAPIARRVHELGLKFGVHMIRGIPKHAVSRNLPILGTRLHAADIWDTAKEHLWDVNHVIDIARPGAQEYYNSLIDLLAEWEVDFVKYDDIVPFPREIEAVAWAIERAKRDMVLSLSPGDVWRVDDMPAYQRANMLRISGDIWDRRSDIERSFDNWEKLQDYGGDGFWLDLDMIPFGKLAIGQRPETADPYTGAERMDRLTPAQKQTFMTQRAMAASPLFMGGDLPSADELSFQLITNPGMLACNQNGVVGKLVQRKDSLDVRRTPHRSRPGSGWVGIFNRAQTPARLQAADIEMGLGDVAGYRFRDIWTDREIVMEPGRVFDIAPDGVAFLRYERTP